MSNMSKKKKVKRRMTLSGSRPGLVSGRRTFGEETKGEEILQMMKKDIACQEVHNNKEAVKGETPKGGEAHNETAHEAAAEATHKAALEVSHEAALEADHEALHETSQETAHKINQKTAPEISIAKVHGGENDELKIRGTRISDSLLMQLEDEAIGFINRRTLALMSDPSPARIDVLIEINRNIASGLQARSGPVLAQETSG